jgi:molybdate transport system substrate-binding protein
MVRGWRMTQRRWGALVAVIAVAVGGCGGDDDESGSDGASPSTSTGELQVYADESLTEAFTQIGQAFEDEHEGIVPKFTFEVTDSLVQQISAGAPAGTFATSDAADVNDLTGLDVEATEPVKFATNTMTIVVPVGNPADIKGLEDLAGPDVKVVLCDPQSACGEHSAEVLAGAGVSVTPTATAGNAGEAVQAVESRTADASIVFASDMDASGDADTVVIPPERNVTAEYVITAVGAAAADNDDIQRAFIDFVQSEAAQGILNQFNFGPP